MSPRYFWADTWTFEQALGQVDAELAESPTLTEDSRLTRLAEQLLELYQGPFLEDESEQACYIAFREQARSKFLRYMSRLIQRWEDAEQWDRVVSYYERGIEVDNLCEGLYRQLMLFYQKRGRSAEAREVYDRCRKTFAALLKASPSPETMAIYESIQSS